MIFLDTSAIYALADTADANHQRATRRLAAALASGERFVTHNYVLVESLALLQHRLGLTAALTLASTRDAFDVEWISPEIHEAAVVRLGIAGRRRLSFVDAASFVVMRTRRIDVAFAFDAHFLDEGFRLWTREAR